MWFPWKQERRTGYGQAWTQRGRDLAGATERNLPVKRSTTGPIGTRCIWTSSAQAGRENGYIESFNGKLRDECLNVEVFFNLADARRKLYLWRRDYDHQRPHSALDERTTAEFAAICNDHRSKQQPFHPVA